eukprot:TRINITY_DN55745_c0_g1_i1.p1 TRINITY_DN55745_c0_g1~~TRINITY_DN55745_c0_g1_i1.p1  ORF type:complete len:655 (-),score=147.89 TRINITY_DN55745_c0_g1_i1:72-2036(-)
MQAALPPPGGDRPAAWAAPPFHPGWWPPGDYNAFGPVARPDDLWRGAWDPQRQWEDGNSSSSTWRGYNDPVGPWPGDVGAGWRMGEPSQGGWYGSHDAMRDHVFRGDPTVCKDFLARRCSRGMNCRFIHPTQALPDVSAIAAAAAATPVTLPAGAACAASSNSAMLPPWQAPPNGEAATSSMLGSAPRQGAAPAEPPPGPPPPPPPSQAPPPPSAASAAAAAGATTPASSSKALPVGPISRLPEPHMPGPVAGEEADGGEQADGKQRGGGKTRTRPPARLWCQILLHKQHPGFDMIPILIGRGGCNMREIHSVTKAKVRIRGRGSGYLEVDGKREAPVPLMVVVTADNSDAGGFRKAVDMTLTKLKHVQERYSSFCVQKGLQAAPVSLFSVGECSRGSDHLLAGAFDGLPTHYSHRRNQSMSDFGTEGAPGVPGSERLLPPAAVAMASGEVLGGAMPPGSMPAGVTAPAPYGTPTGLGAFEPWAAAPGLDATNRPRVPPPSTSPPAAPPGATTAEGTVRSESLFASSAAPAKSNPGGPLANWPDKAALQQAHQAKARQQPKREVPDEPPPPQPVPAAQPPPAPVPTPSRKMPLGDWGAIGQKSQATGAMSAAADASSPYHADSDRDEDDDEDADGYKALASEVQEFLQGNDEDD